MRVTTRKIYSCFEIYAAIALWDLIAATGLVILHKSDPNRRFLGLCDLEIWQVTWKTTGNLFHTHRSYVGHFTASHKFEFEQTSWNAQIRAKASIFTLCDLEIWQMALKTRQNVFYDANSFVHPLTLSQCTLAGPVYTGMPLVDPVYTVTPLEKLCWNSPTLECHWRNLIETVPHWNATGETLTVAAYPGTPLEGL